MSHFRVIAMFLLSYMFWSDPTFAFAIRAPKEISFPEEAYREGTPAQASYYPSNSGFGGVPSSDMAKLAQSAGQGAGNIRERGALCYRAVKQIIADALGKDLSCVRGILSSGSAKDAGRDLLRMGFVEDSSKCKTPGVVRVYSGRRGPGRPTAGDIHGHIEVMGDDGRFHYFQSSPTAIDESSGGRRILTGCYVPHYDKIRSAPLAHCPDARNSLRTRQRGQGGAQ